MTKDADGKGYHCDKCGKEVQFPCCEICYPKEHAEFVVEQLDHSNF
jgi:hypothetical protein